MSRTSAPKLKVSIGVCVRNSAATLAEAIKSVVNQNFPHDLMELIFVDDGSEDKTLPIIKEYSSNIDLKVKIIHTAWSGLGHARNLVLSNASGEYVVWLDGDMILSRDFVKQLVDFMEHNHTVAVAKGKQSLERGGNLLATLETYSRAAGRMVDYNSEKGRHTALGTGGSIYRVAAILKAGGFDENLRRYGEDWDAEIRVRRAGWSLGTVDVKFSDYERHKITWKSLWNRYWLRGFYSHYFLHKNQGLIKQYRMSPPSAFLMGIVQSRKLFPLTNDRTVFLMPFPNALKSVAWNVGFMESHMKSYQPLQKSV